MKNITINSMRIIGFKGITDLSLSFGGHSAVIAGRNGTGKTSVYDAFLWLLFGKVSDGSKADVKPVDGNGQRKSGVDCEVAAALTVDGKSVTLRRVWHEVWRKTAGGENVYDRDETLCWVDDVPVKLEKEYQPYVLSLVGGDEKAFQLITDHGAFMRQHWTERRKQLMAVAGDDAEAEIANRPEFAGIHDVLAGGTAEDAKKRLMDQKKRLNAELTILPARVDELTRTMQPVSEEELRTARTCLANLETMIADVDTQLGNTTAQAQAMNELISQKRALERRLAKLTYDEEQAKKQAVAELTRELYKLNGEQNRLLVAISCDRVSVKAMKERAEELEQERLEQLSKYHALERESYVNPDMDEACPVCGQPLPTDMVRETREKHREQWEEAHESRIALVLKKGKAAKQEKETAISDIADTLNRIDAQQKAADALAEKISALNMQIEKQMAEKTDLDAIPEYAQTKAELAKVDAQIDSFGTDTRRAELTAQRADLTRQLDSPRAVIARADQSGYVQQRIEELTSEKKQLGAQLTHVEGQLELLGQYVRARCTAMEETINSRFGQIRWKLFDIAKNGSVQDCCTATVGGVPYGAGLNNGASINAGIEIIRALSRVYDVSAPCFVDNAEAVNTLARTDGQMIELRVSTDDSLTMTTYDD